MKNVYVDEHGKRHYQDDDGKIHYGITPMRSERNSKDGEFTTYDTSEGHCGLCGWLTCRGGCFK